MYNMESTLQRLPALLSFPTANTLMLCEFLEETEGGDVTFLT